MSTGSTQPFTPSGTTSVAATTASASGALSAGDTVLIYNSGTTLAFVAFGSGAATATAAGTPVPPGASRLLYIGSVANYAAAIFASGSGTVYFTTGTGTVY